ncbi:MAG: ABC-type lipopolysaccharide export system outer membrane lipoprotein component LptE [Rhodobacteraceae bacterium HLUCCA12]|nr:MAG: ABC-type lipopolysaccharide export system outer membrane lipoprotein component LptE [Rhodobacteraceae bacterium HLUCCA12]
MSLSDRRSVLLGLAAVAGLAGCRFSPVYAPGGVGRALQGAVRADDPSRRDEYHFVAAFEERLGRPVSPRYALSYRIGQRRIGGDASRVQVLGVLEYVLSDIAGGQEIAAGRVDASAGYSRTGTQLAEQAAAEDAEVRLMRMLVDSLVLRLTALPDLSPA